MNNYEVFYIFFISLSIILLFSIREAIELGYHKTKGKWENILIIVTRSLMGALIVIISFDALQQAGLTITLMGTELEIKDKVAVFISTITMLFGDELIKKTQKVIRGGK